MRFAVPLAFAVCSVALAQSDSVLPPDLQQQVDRIRSQSHFRNDPPPPEISVVPKAVSLEDPADTAADEQDNEAILAGSEAIAVDDLQSSSELRARTEQRTKEMLAAAQRRVDRDTAKLQRAQAAAERGLIDARLVQNIADDLAGRQQIMALANERASMLGELIEMADAVVVRPNGARLVNAGTLRYDGSGRLIRPSELAALEVGFTRRFAKRLPISAWGESMTHVELGFDHRGRIDVAVYPDSAEGLFIRSWLEKQHIPYFAFRSAVFGRATGPHIHIGPGSTRLVRASLPLHLRSRE